MAQASKRVRQLRKLKRERTIAYRMVDIAVEERDKWRAIAQNQHNQMEAIHKVALQAELDAMNAAKVGAIEPAFTQVEEVDGE